MEGYCRYCYRPTSLDQPVCFVCKSKRHPRQALARLLAILGVAGLPVLIIGVLSLNARMCLTGAIVSGTATLIHLYIATR